MFNLLQLLSFFEEKKFISRIFSQHRFLGEKRKDTWIYEDKKCKEHFKNRLKIEDLYLSKLVKEDDVTELCLASSTRPRRRNLLAALAQYTVSHFRSSSTKSSSWFLSSLIFWVSNVAQISQKSRNRMSTHHRTAFWRFWADANGFS